METLKSDTSYQIWAEFKSYYVVWKQSIPCEEWFNVFGLNRTMQYGNINKKIYEKISNIV